MTTESLQDLFKSSFDNDRWTDFLHIFFGANALYTQPRSLDKHEGDKGFLLGEFTTTDGYRVGFYRFDIASGSVLRRKTGLRHLVERYLKTEYDAAIAVFTEKGSSLWRFSYICDIKGVNTHPKRFTYVFGSPDQQYRTPIERFLSLQTARGKKQIPRHTDILAAFAVEPLSEQFYSELASWYKWAIETIKLPIVADHLKNQQNGIEQNTAQFAIRLLCRTLFCWFLKERHLISSNLLNTASSNPIASILHDFPNGNHYYRGILQNIFFNCLNTPMGAARRVSAAHATNDKTVSDPTIRKLNYLGKNYLPAAFDYSLFDAIPYLNGGLFDRLEEDNASDTIDDAVIFIPNHLFCNDYGDAKNAGLNTIFSRYNFTIEENSPDDAEIALDPELLGLVFENLLAEVDSNDPDAQKSARKASGSYYTPRRIIDYMVNEAIRLHLENFIRTRGATPTEAHALSDLFLRNRWDPAAAPRLSGWIVEALDTIHLLDPACGSGAFPMGALHRMVEILHIVDENNALWLGRYLDRLPAEIRDAARRQLSVPGLFDYARKLGLIKNTLYGVDIQPLAVLITKLRFFISLLAEQTPNLNDPANNYGLIPFPNLETKILCANTLREVTHDMFTAEAVKKFQAARDEYYQPNLPPTDRDRLAQTIAEKLSEILPDFAKEAIGQSYPDHALQKQRNVILLKEWFRHSTLPAPFFLFDVFFPEVVSSENASGFDIVIGNPPYGGTKISNEIKNSLALGSTEIYGAFIARFIGDGKKKTPLRPDGILAYIVSDTFMTIKTHFPLRKQLMGSRLHKAIRVPGDTFKATVNTVIFVAQKGDGPGYKAPPPPPRRCVENRSLLPDG